MIHCDTAPRISLTRGDFRDTVFESVRKGAQMQTVERLLMLLDDAVVADIARNLRRMQDTGEINPYDLEMAQVLDLADLMLPIEV